MNDTNRALNRTVLFLVGLVLLVVGGAAATAAAIPAVGEVWASSGSAAIDALRAAGDATTIGGTTLSWAVIGATAAFIIRGGALHFGWTFPTYKHKPGRHPDEVM